MIDTVFVCPKCSGDSWRVVYQNESKRRCGDCGFEFPEEDSWQYHYRAFESREEYEKVEADL